MISCPGGPTTQTFIGRVDAQGPAPANQLPTANVSAAEAKSHFANAGFSSQDLAALIGAHTASRQFNTDLSKVGASEDSTPGIWVSSSFNNFHEQKLICAGSDVLHPIDCQESAILVPE